MKKLFFIFFLSIFLFTGCAGLPRGDDPELLAKADFGTYPDEFEKIITYYLKNYFLQIIYDKNYILNEKREAFVGGPIVSVKGIVSGNPKKQNPAMKPGSYNYEIIFSGITDKSIHLIYREFTPEDLGKPAFNQHVNYNPDKKYIRFKNTKIKIHEIIDEKIVYTVVEDGLNKNAIDKIVDLEIMKPKQNWYRRPDNKQPIIYGYETRIFFRTKNKEGKYSDRKKYFCFIKNKKIIKFDDCKHCGQDAVDVFFNMPYKMKR